MLSLLENADIYAPEPLGSGCLPHFDADLVGLDEQHRVRHVMARGRWMVQHGTPLRPGLFVGLFEGLFETPVSAD